MIFLNILKFLISFLLENLTLIHKGTIAMKLKASFILAFYSAPIIFILEKVTDWYMMNYAYVTFTLVAIIFDHLLGTWVHAKILKDFSWRRNIQGFFSKVILVLIGAVMIEGIIDIIQPVPFVADYVKVMSRLVVFIYPAGSALMNCSLLTGGKFPPTAFMKKIANFNSGLDPTSFGEDKPKDEGEPKD